MTGIVIQLVFVALALIVLGLITIDDRRSQRIRREADERRQAGERGLESDAPGGEAADEDQAT